ncbi:MAG TPA: thioredoxin family protein [Bacteroidia bacterium]|nr:thioredoxin family protein [Bacteroidia bacterium]HRD39328.1 thioredoxin family protein [Bacteroidia bacterium]
MNLNHIFNTAKPYPEYRQLVDELISQGKTTGNNQEQMLIDFTKLNVQRMNRIDKTVQIPEELKQQLIDLDISYDLLLIGDAWCGDCAQIIPVIQKIVESSEGKLNYKIISRDTFPDLMEAYSTNGAKSVPKLLIMKKDHFDVIATWGPRPKPAQEIMLHWKANQDTISWEDFEKNLHLWYAKDKGLIIMHEITNLLVAIKSKMEV